MQANLKAQLVLLILGLAFLAQGCGFSLMLPTEFQQKKQAMDPVPGAPADSGQGGGSGAKP